MARVLRQNVSALQNGKRLAPRIQGFQKFLKYLKSVSFLRHRDTTMLKEVALTALMSRRAAMMSGAAAGVFVAGPTLASNAQTHSVQMLNADPDDRHRRMIFSPRLLVVQPGDTVRFEPTDKGHNSASIDGMLPPGVEGWNGRINQEIEIRFEQPGLYGYQCTPHLGMGMVGLIVVQGVGALANLEAAQDARKVGRSRRVWDEIWSELAELDLPA